MQIVKDKIFARIRAKGRGAVYATKDFLDLGSRAAVDQALSRLVKEKALRRLRRGLFDYPRVNPKLGGELSADVDQVAHALARKVSSRIQPSGALAANALGLSTQVPAKRVYLTDGASRKIRVGNETMVFKHASPKSLVAKSKTSTLVLQALRYLGKGGVGDEVIEKLRATLSDQDKKRLVTDTRYASDWIVEVVQKIARENPLNKQPS